jgi:hypothetical protein
MHALLRVILCLLRNVSVDVLLPDPYCFFMRWVLAVRKGLSFVSTWYVFGLIEVCTGQIGKLWSGADRALYIQWTRVLVLGITQEQ